MDPVGGRRRGTPNWGRVARRLGAWVVLGVPTALVALLVFSAEARGYYDLDGLWGDAAQVQWQDAEHTPETAAQG